MSEEFTEEDIEAYYDTVKNYLNSEKEIDKINNIIATKIDNSNWKEKVKDRARKVMDEEKFENLTPEKVTTQILDDALKMLPDELQNAVESYIIEVLKQKKIPAKQIKHQKL